MIKLISLTFLTINLAGCVVADMDSTNYQYPPYVTTIQKKGALGHTDPVQRKKDIYSCGISREINPDNADWRRNQLSKGEISEEHDVKISRFENCMKEKGYKLLDFSSCGPLKAPTGLCN